MDLRKISALVPVQQARSLLHTSDAETMREQLALVSIPAPPFGESKRGGFVESRFAELGLQDIQRDEVGNVLARLPEPSGSSAEAADTGPVLLTAHLDTVFPEGTETSPRWVGGRVYAPGIADNARGLAALLALARVMVQCHIRTSRPLVFAATVGEEGLGDLRGVKHLFRNRSPFRDSAAFLSLDGSGIRRIVHRAIGSRRFRVSIRGVGGHSWADWGAANPVHALGLAIVELRKLSLPSSPPATLTVARLGGGTSVNAIPAEAWLELDTRSESPQALDALEKGARRALARAAEEENLARRRGPALSYRFEKIGERPSGTIPADTPLVQTAMTATQMVGMAPDLVASSTDSNVPIALGIPAVTLGAGGESGGVHTVEEWYHNQDGARGIERALLTVVAAAGVEKEAD